MGVMMSQFGVTGRVPRVLYVDSDPLSRRLAECYCLASGWALMTAATGAEAVSLAGEATYSAIACNAVLDDMTGLELGQAIRDRAFANRRTPLFVVTSSAELVNKVQAERIGVREVLEHPISLTRFQDTVRRLNSRTPALVA
ncbi:MAG: response regulator [Minwuia sp.]|uniref:response regulator n=1 Tax=Minwuia sp. TaxID=2493630 RepID=UPI003A86362D